MVPMLTGWLKLGQHRAHGTSLAIIMFVAISGVAGYWHAGNIDWRLVLTLSPGAIVGCVRGREGDGESARAPASAAVRSVSPLRRISPVGVAGIGWHLARRRERAC